MAAVCLTSLSRLAAISRPILHLLYSIAFAALDITGRTHKPPNSRIGRSGQDRALTGSDDQQFDSVLHQTIRTNKTRRISNHNISL
jgi:hypothetical protein